MGPELQAHLAFHLTGNRMGSSLRPVEDAGLRPALLARYGDLTRLRYDFPLVLVSGSGGPEAIRALSVLVNEALKAIVPQGDAGEAKRQRALRVEREIRTLVANGETGLLSRLWDVAAQRIGAGDDPALAADLRAVRAAIKVDGEVVDCTQALPEKLLTHAWHEVERRKAEHFDRELERLSVRVSDILRADFVRSKAGTSPERLMASVGSGMEALFDFKALSTTLARTFGQHTLSDAQRQRLQGVHATLEAYRARTHSGRDPATARAFANCRDALAAFHDRTQDIVDVVKAIALAELETEGAYVESAHDPYFAAFDEGCVGAKDLALFPDFLVRIASQALREPENAALMEILSSDMPIKVLLEVGDVLDEPALHAHLGFVAPGTQLGRMAISLGTVYVVQSSSSNLYRARHRLAAGLAHTGPALFSVYTGAAPGALAPYLHAAAALQSRAFPAFSYDPALGADTSARFALEGNPQPQADWTMDEFDYQDASHQRAAQDVAFTFADFVACDPRHSRHFALVPRSEWSDAMVPIADFIAADASVVTGKVPYIDVVDADLSLNRALVDESLVTASRRCRDSWRGLQELGGIRSSPVERLLARERQAWEESKREEIAALQRAAPAAVAPAVGMPSSAPAVQATQATQAATAAAEPEKPSDDPYIETVRCTTCNECTTLNNRMFAYDTNKQAFIADANAGTYRELVEAAESCQVSIIHPGKPRNPNEAGLAELQKRAEAFL